MTVPWNQLYFRLEDSIGSVTTDSCGEYVFVEMMLCVYESVRLPARHFTVNANMLVPEISRLKLR